MDPRLDSIAIDVKDIKQHVLELVKQGAVHNQILLEHHQRSTQLENRVSPLEDAYKFNQTLFKYLAGSSGILGALAVCFEIAKALRLLP